LTVYELPARPVITLTDRTLSSGTASGNQWYFNDAEIAGATNQTHVAEAEGSYYVIVTSEQLCVSEPSNVLTVSFTGMADFSKWEVNIYPNPASDKLYIENQSGMEMLLELYDITGKMIVNSILTGDLEVIDVQGIRPSIYFLKIPIDDSRQQKKLIIE
jgi:hypothetical protein